MRTTIDIPDDLFRRVKAVAALKGITLKNLVRGFIEQGLEHSSSQPLPAGQKRRIPVSIAPAGREIRNLTNAEIEALLYLEDLEDLGLDRSA
ncbi:MAG: hypothetical protein ACHQ50_05035 [Fimbriimonadales bacterium]